MDRRVRGGGGRIGADPVDGPSIRPEVAEVPHFTDSYFRRSKQAVGRFGDMRVTYAVFMRRPVISAARLTVEWLRAVAEARGAAFEIEQRYGEGLWVGAGDPLLHISGSLYHLIDLETLYLQKLGAACVAAYNAYAMCRALPNVGFLAMDARHCAGTDMAELMAYAASTGSEAAKRDHGAVGFVGNATDATAHFFGQSEGFGTMPHALIGYAGSTVRAAELFAETFPDTPITVVTDYYGAETTDAIAVCRRFPEMAARGRISIRLDTHGGRYAEGLDLQESYAVLDRNVPRAIRDYRTEGELRHLVGTGVTAAAIWHLRETLDGAGFPKVRIVASSGFTAGKCRVMALAEAPVDMIGTGSFLPDHWSETYATADIVEYDGNPSVKVGREFLLRRK